MIRQDYIQRAIEELSRAVAALLSRRSEPAETLKEVSEAKRHVPLTPGLLDVLSAQDIAKRLGDERLVKGVATLLRLEGEAHGALGNTQQASRLTRRADALLACGAPNRTPKESQPQ